VLGGALNVTHSRLVPYIFSCRMLHTRAHAVNDEFSYLPGAYCIHVLIVLCCT